MSVTLIFPYAIYAAGSTVTLDRATEAALVQQRRATYVSDPGSVFGPLSAVEQQSLRDFLPSGQALVSGAGSFLGSFTWAARPTPTAIGQQFFATDIGPTGAWFHADAALAWWIRPGTHLYYSTTQIVGVASAALQSFGAAVGIPRSVLAACRHYHAQALFSKDATATNATTQFYEGVLGTSGDTAILSTSTFAAANRQFSTGVVRRYNAATARTQLAVVSTQIGVDSGGVSTTAHPATLSAVYADTTIFFLPSITMAGVGDIPALERFNITAY